MKRRTLTALLFVALIWTAVSATLRIGGHEVAYDAKSARMLCCVPDSVFGTDYIAVVELTDSTWSNLAIDSVAVDSALAQVTFADVGPSRAYLVTATNGNGKPVDAQLQFTYHPIVEISLTSPTKEYQPCTVRVLQPDTCITSAAKVKIRGGYTSQAWLHKKNFHIKFTDSVGNKVEHELLGLRTDNSWILDAGQVEETRMRNHVATELWNTYARKPYYAAAEPKARSGVRGEPVELMLAGNYFGVYVLTEAMDRKQMRLRKYDEQTGEVRGRLWKTVTKTSTTLMTAPAAYDNSLEEWDGVEVKYPDFEDINPTDYGVLWRALEAVAQATNQADVDSVAACRFDLPVLLDYVILLHTVLGHDNIAKNIYWACYDCNADERLTLAVWDLDATAGHTWNGYGRRFEPTANLLAENKLFTALWSRQSAHWPTLLKRYSELRMGPLSTQALLQRYTDKITWLQGSGAAARETERWSGDRDLNYNTIDYDYELAWLCDWLTRRMEYLDNGLFAIDLPGDADLNGLIDVSDLNMALNAILDPSCASRLHDTDGNNQIDVSDVNAIINAVLAGNAAPNMNHQP